MSKGYELILKNVVLALQLCLGVWQFTKLTPVGALIQGVVSWLLRPFGLSETYSTLQELDGRVFKKANCLVVQPEIPSARSGVVELGSQKGLQLHVKYLGKPFVLERSGSDGNMLLVNGKMCYYIIPTVWEELQVLENVTDLVAPIDYAGATIDYADIDAAADAAHAAAHAADAAARARDEAAEWSIGASREPESNISDSDAVFAAQAIDIATTAAAASSAASAAAAAAERAAAANPRADSVVLKGHREFWEEVSTGGIMSFDEVLDGLILHDQHLSLPLADKWLLPVDLSVSEEKLLKILNLFAVFLQTKKEKVHWLIPTSLSFISAILEFNTPLRVWLYSNINVLFCSIMHSMCDLLPRPWRRQVYSLGKWVENLKPTNDIPLKIQRGPICAIIAGVAKIDRQDASLVPWSDVGEEKDGKVVNRFPCDSIPMDMTCTYYVRLNRCKIDAPTVSSMFTVECRSLEKYRRIITLVSCMAKNGCGSLKFCGPHKSSCGPHNKVSVRGFRESVLCYVKSGFPPVYELQLENVVLT